MDVNMDKRDWAKDMVESVIAYTPGGRTDDPEDVLDSYNGKRYLSEYVKIFGRNYIINLIALEQERIDYITTPNDDGYVTVHYKNNKH